MPGTPPGYPPNGPSQAWPGCGQRAFGSKIRVKTLARTALQISRDSPGVKRQITQIRAVIRCLTIAIQDAVALNIALELIMPGRPPRYLNEQIKQPTASPFAVEA